MIRLCVIKCANLEKKKKDRKERRRRRKGKIFAFCIEIASPQLQIMVARRGRGKDVGGKRGGWGVGEAVKERRMS